MIDLRVSRPRPYQLECIVALDQARADGCRKGLVVMASGLGKTLTAIFDLQQFLDELPNARVLYLCDQESILLQSKAKFQREFGEEYSYGMFTGDYKTSRSVTFLFATFQTMRDHRDEFSKDVFDYIIVDEAHHTAAETYQPTVDYFEPRFLLGLTATKKRSDGQDLLETYQRIVYEKDIYDGWAEGWLAQVDYRIMLDDLNEKTFEQYVGPHAATEKVSLAQLNRTIFAPQRDESIVASIREQTADLDNPSVFVFCSSIAHANAMAEHFSGEAAVMHSGQSSDLNAAILARFRSGEIRIIISVNMLNEGIDVPEADVVVFLRATESSTIFFQQLGRGLRISGAKRTVRVLDYVSNIERVSMVLEMEEESQQRIKSAPNYSPSTFKPEPLVVNIPATKFKVQRVDVERLLAGNSRSIWTKEELIARLRQRAEELGRTPVCSDIGRDHPPCWEVYRYVFGDWNAALRAAGLGVNVRHHTAEGLINDILMLHEELGRTPTSKDITADKRCASLTMYRKTFGSWNNAVAAAGLTVTRHNTNEELLEYLRVIIAELGYPPTIEEFKQMKSKPSPSVYVRRFKGWSRAIALATDGACRARSPRPTELELIADLERLVIRLGRLPKATEVNEEKTMAHASTYRRSFGPSWKDVLRNTGVVELAKRTQMPKPLLTPKQVEVMRDFVRRNHRILHIKDVLSLEPNFKPYHLRKKGSIGAINAFIGADQILAELEQENN